MRFGAVDHTLSWALHMRMPLNRVFSRDSRELLFLFSVGGGRTNGEMSEGTYKPRYNRVEYNVTLQSTKERTGGITLLRLYPYGLQFFT